MVSVGWFKQVAQFHSAFGTVAI